MVTADGGGAVTLAGEDIGGRETGVSFFAHDPVVIADPAGITGAEG